MITRKLNDVLDPITCKGIFTIIHELALDAAFLNDENVKNLDLEYYYGHSGEKRISLLYTKLIEKFNDEAIYKIAEIIINNYMDNWKNIYNAFTMEYNPIENYDSTEVENVGSKVTTSLKAAANVYGFNSDAAVPTGDNTSSSTTEGNKNDNVRELHRHGNIGVTTSQQMLESEIKMRQYKFYIQMMNDIDKTMCLKIY